MEDALHLACIRKEGLGPYSDFLKKFLTERREKLTFFSHRKLFFEKLLTLIKMKYLTIFADLYYRIRLKL